MRFPGGEYKVPLTESAQDAMDVDDALHRATMMVERAEEAKHARRVQAEADAIAAAPGLAAAAAARKASLDAKVDAGTATQREMVELLELRR